jgi:predicted enzyme related to lactoylglutathione lyase
MRRYAYRQSQNQRRQITQEKKPIPGVGYMAFCQDTEGNPFGLIQMDENATAASA